MARTSTLTDLEAAALAQVAEKGGATSYAVARAFAQSPAEYWSGSAGAVYPLMERLLKRGWLQANAGAQGKRKRTQYQITDAGRQELEGWLGDVAGAAGMGMDPLRTRLAHLGNLPEAKRREFLNSVRAELVAQSAVPAWPDDQRLQALHASWLANRIAWIDQLERVL